MIDLKRLVGSGDRIALLTLPFVIVAVALDLAWPGLFSVGGPPAWLGGLSIAMLVVGLVVWLWSVVLILRNVPQGRLITNGPYGWVRHPLYTAVALLVLPWVGFLLDTWLGLVVGVVMYLAARILARAEEAELSRTFGPSWSDYSRHVKLGWL